MGQNASMRKKRPVLQIHQMVDHNKYVVKYDSNVLRRNKAVCLEKIGKEQAFQRAPTKTASGCSRCAKGSQMRRVGPEHKLVSFVKDEQNGLA